MTDTDTTAIAAAHGTPRRLPAVAAAAGRPEAKRLNRHAVTIVTRHAVENFEGSTS